MRSKDNIFLIGMMASWKSTVGRKIAPKLGMQFVDTDDIIESEQNFSIREIFFNKGESEFREIEHEVLLKQAKKTNTIISTGGGIVINPHNRSILLSKGYTILLRATPKSLVSRLKSVKRRPLLPNINNIEHELKKIWSFRKSLYEESADFILDTDFLNPKQVSQSIFDHIKEFHANH